MQDLHVPMLCMPWEPQDINIVPSQVTKLHLLPQSITISLHICHNNIAPPHLWLQAKVTLYLHCRVPVMFLNGKEASPLFSHRSNQWPIFSWTRLLAIIKHFCINILLFKSLCKVLNRRACQNQNMSWTLLYFFFCYFFSIFQQ